MSSSSRIWTGPKFDYESLQSEQHKSLGHYILDKLRNDQANHIILTDDGTGATWSGSQLYESILKLAHALVDRYEIELGTPVIIKYQNSDTLYILALALICTGATVLSMHYKDPYEELSYSAQMLGIKFLFCEEKYRDSWTKRLSDELEYHVESISIDGIGSSSLSSLLDYDRTQSTAAVPRIPRDIKSQVAFIIMSSGTTGKPKAVTSTHYSCMVEMMMQPFSLTGFPKGTAVACPASLDYISSRLQLLTAIQSGFNAIILRDFGPETFARAVEKHRINVIYLGAAGFFNFITWPNLYKYDLSSLRVVFPMGAKVIYLKELREFLNKHPGIKMVRQGYGSSETSVVSMNTVTPDKYLEDCENAGKLLSGGISAKIIDPQTGEMLGVNQTGVIYVKSEAMFAGYYNQCLMKERDGLKLADKSVFTEDGYYCSGDLAFFNDKDELHILGRQQELMNCRETKKVFPQELEDVLGKHPAVKKVCVIGVPNKTIALLHCPRAFVVPIDEAFKDPSIIESIKYSRPTEPLVDEERSASDENLATRSEPRLVHSGNPETQLSSLATSWRHILAEDLMEFTNERVSWRKQLTGGIVILDDIPILRETGKMNKSYLRSLTLDLVEIYGNLSE